MTDTTNLPRLEDMLNDPYFEEEEEDENEEDEDKAYSDDEMMDESHPSYGERMKKREYKKRMLNSRRIAKQISKPPRTRVEKDYYSHEAKKGLSYGASVAGLLLEMSSQVYQNGVDLRFLSFHSDGLVIPAGDIFPVF